MLRVRMVSTGFVGAPGYNNFFFDGDTTLDAQNAHDAVTIFAAGLSSITNNSVVRTVESDVPFIDPATGDITGVQTLTATNTPGGWGNLHAPGGTALVVRWLTNTFTTSETPSATTRRLRGRSFISGLGDIGEGAQGVAAVNVTDVENAANALITDPDSVLQVYSPTHRVAAICSGTSVWNKFGLIRSRRD